MKECVILKKDDICPYDQISGRTCTYCKIPDMYLSYERYRIRKCSEELPKGTGLYIVYLESKIDIGQKLGNPVICCYDSEVKRWIDFYADYIVKWTNIHI
jgi:hypothetical protein